MYFNYFIYFKTGELCDTKRLQHSIRLHQNMTTRFLWASFILLYDHDKYVFLKLKKRHCYKTINLFVKRIQSIYNLKQCLEFRLVFVLISILKSIISQASQLLIKAFPDLFHISFTILNIINHFKIFLCLESKFTVGRDKTCVWKKNPYKIMFKI